PPTERTPMRSYLTIACLLILATSAVAGGRRRPATASPSAADELSIAFVGMSSDGNDALFDAGVASRPRGVIVRTFGVRIDSITRTTGTVVVRAWLEANDGRSAIRIDGRPLGAQPRIIDANAPL